jgi:predicted ester cyclase/heme-degrading monooxygenase HmoA
MKLKGKSILLVGIFLSISIWNFSQSRNSVINKNKEQKMENGQSIKNKEIIRGLYENALNKKNLGLLKIYIADDFIGFKGKRGYEAFAEPFLALIEAAPDLEYKIEELISEGDKVVVKWKLHGTQTGKFQYVLPTGKTFENTGMAIFKLQKDKIITAQVLTDRLGFLQELGVPPPDISSIARQSTKEAVRFIDKFFVPADVKKEFLQRIAYNRNFLRTLPGFIKDEAYEQADEKGNLVVITIAVWQSIDFVNRAKEAVQKEYNRINFNLPEFLQQSDITMERGIYRESDN